MRSDLDHGYKERLDHGYKEGPRPRPRAEISTTAMRTERRDLDHGYKERPGPRLQGGTWTTATSRDFDHCNEE
ncbi:hypothetical protein RRG08_044970 [Elysia crispata]|uniref:Uncharacterized protein n=1 Tax=Elysia crispata TaxID=231223 RepID=A0AAE0ZX45_9GAST|nr:hypothetical protein RRG08_044970 [Elysia crispata]